jgi:hypothetical protein
MPDSRLVGRASHRHQSLKVTPVALRLNCTKHRRRWRNSTGIGKRCNEAVATNVQYRSEQRAESRAEFGVGVGVDVPFFVNHSSCIVFQ